MRRIRIIILGMLIMSGCAHTTGPLRDGSCPPEFPVKGNANSFIYHTPRSFSYFKTKAEVCFDSPDAAIRHGFRAPKFCLSPRRGGVALTITTK